jgi:hypothetical protein
MNDVTTITLNFECGNTKTVTVTGIKPTLESVDFKNGGIQTITDVGLEPEWKKADANSQGDRNEPFCSIKNQNVNVFVKITAQKNLTFSTSIIVRDYPGVTDPVYITLQNWPYNFVLLRTSPNNVDSQLIQYNWAYSIDNGQNWIQFASSSHTMYVTWAKKICSDTDFIKDKISKSITKAGSLQLNHTEEELATNICKNVNGIVSGGCICGDASFDYHFQGAMGNHSDGMCCCRAKGMIVVLQVLGLQYDQAYDNELPPPNQRKEIPDNKTCTICGPMTFRGAFGGGIFNNWQGVAYNGTNKHYSPQGWHISPYSTMVDAPEYPSSQPPDTTHAFEYYKWRYHKKNSQGQWIEYGCPHLGKP